jgi:ribonuclease-3
MKINNLVKDETLLKKALTHSSYANEKKLDYSYERLEFLGDSVLSLIVSEYLYSNYNLNEGDMSKKRASFVCEEALEFYAKKIDLQKHILVGQGSKETIETSIIADVFESLLGAIYIDSGFESAKNFVYKTVIPYIKEEREFFNDYKTIIKEIIGEKEALKYVLKKEKGSAHDKTFYVDLVLGNLIYGKGIGKSKKEAEQNAAKDAYKKRVG